MKESSFYGSIKQNFHFIEKITSTSVSHIWVATKNKDKDDKNSKKLSLKFAKLSTDNHIIQPFVFRELILLNEINHPHIIKLIPQEVICDIDDSMIGYCYERHLIDMRKLVRYYQRQNGTVSHIVAKSCLFQLLLALDYLHSRSIAHCNITTANIVLMPQTERTPGILKLFDLGYSRLIDPHNLEKSLIVVHPWFRAPEILLGDKEYDQKIDIWATGCVFAELLTGKILFESTKKDYNNDINILHSNQLMTIINILGSISESDCAHPQRCTNLPQIMQIQPQGATSRLNEIINATPEALDLLSKLLTYNASKRISAKEALNHPYFSAQPICVMNIAGQISKDTWDDIFKTIRMAPALPPRK